MTTRGIILTILVGLPVASLIAFGPRSSHDVPTNRTFVTYWEKWSGVEGAAMKRVVRRFNDTVGAAQGIWVDYCSVSNVEQRTLIATAGGDPPDVAGLYDFVIAQFADQGALLPLDALADEFGIEEDAFKPIWWNIGVYRSSLYALPSAPYTIALLYNKRLFREAGLDPRRPPRTIDELDEYSRRLTRRDGDGRITQAGFMPAPKLLGWWHWVWPYFFNTSIWDGARFTLDTPPGRACMQWIARRRAEIGFKDALTFEDAVGAIEGPQNPFISERVAMVFQGPWIANWVRAYNPSLEYGVARFPSTDASRRPVFASSDVFVIPAGARHPRQAMIFLRYVLRRDVMEAFCREHGKVSPFREPGPRFFEDHPNPHIRTFDDLARSDETFGYPKMPTFNEASHEMLFMLDSVLQGVRDPEEAVRTTQRKVDAVVDRYNRMRAARLAAGGGTDR